MNKKFSQQYEREDVSIVIPIYNDQDTVAKAIESALMQKMPYTSIVYCINDASTDKSFEIVKYYANKYPDKIKVYTSLKNQGSAKKSILHNRPPIRGRYWCFLGADDFWTSSEKLAKQISFLDSQSDYVGCSCNTVMIDESTGEESVIKPDRNAFNLLDLILLKNRYAFYVHTTSIIWRNIYFDQGFFIPPSYKKKYAFGDVVLMHMMLAKGGKIHNMPEVMSCYRVTGRGLWTSKSVEEQEKSSEILNKALNRSIPYKYKLFTMLQGYRNKCGKIKQLIPGPVND